MKSAGAPERQARTEGENGNREGVRDGSTNQIHKIKFFFKKATQVVDGDRGCVLSWRQAAHSRMLAE